MPLSMTFILPFGNAISRPLVPKVILWEVSFYSHLMRDIFVSCLLAVSILRTKRDSSSFTIYNMEFTDNISTKGNFLV